MAKVKAKISSEPTKPIRPAISPENRESRMISLAMDLVEQRLLNGTASSQETTHFLKLATAREQLEREKIKEDIALSRVKQENIRAQARSEEMMKEALTAFRRYSGQGVEDDEY